MCLSQPIWARISTNKITRAQVVSGAAVGARRTVPTSSGTTPLNPPYKIGGKASAASRGVICGASPFTPPAVGARCTVPTTTGTTPLNPPYKIGGEGERSEQGGDLRITYK
ncbi:MAG: hypothetical protein PHH87_01210 [Desulfuromonas sp.]|jgi:hypothetical protein|nr:hypothetical protein [Desulfuromonas sp.]